jgi:MFS transporter, AAHS family, 4-hydroxybenzoate transporter
MTKTIDLFERTEMVALQKLTIFICFLLNMLDGMDVMVISYAANTIAKGWTISPQALGVVLSAGLFGMTVGTFVLAPRADVIGRRALILACALLMGLVVFATSFATSVEQLIAYRFISGLGIGGVLPISAALAAEYAPKATKDFWVSFVMSGYPIGAVLSGIVAGKVIPLYGWQTMFQIAGATTLLTLPFVYFFMSESLDFILKKQPAGALQKANVILAKMNQTPLAVLPSLSAVQVEKTAISSLFTPERKISTLNLWIALFMSFATMYYLLTWIPKLAAAMGLPEALAIYAGAVFNLGAVAGIWLQGYLSEKFGLRRIILIFMIKTAILMALFTFFKGSAIVLVLFGLLGFAMQGGFVGLYAVAAAVYPTEIRSTGMGWAMGAGRIGAILSPIIGGYLLDAKTGFGWSMTATFIFFAVPALLAGIATWMIDSKEIR